MDLIDWASKIPIHDLSDGKGLCRVIFAEDFLKALKQLPTAERTEYYGETKAVPSEGDYVRLSEKVEATFYDDEYEEWSLKTVTIREVLDAICEKYTVEHLPSAERTGHWIEIGENAHTYKCSECGRLLVNITDGKNHVYEHYPYCHCGAKMEVEHETD